MVSNKMRLTQYYFDGENLSPILHSIIEYRRDGKTRAFISNKILKSGERIRQLEAKAFKLVSKYFNYSYYCRRDFFSRKYGMNYFLELEKSYSKYIDRWIEREND